MKQRERKSITTVHVSLDIGNTGSKLFVHSYYIVVHNHTCNKPNAIRHVPIP